MTKIPKFKLYGEDDETFSERIQRKLPLRPWSNLTEKERDIMYQDLVRADWIEESLIEVIDTVERLNFDFKRILPAIKTFKSYPDSSHYNDAAISDFGRIFIAEESEDLALLMISLFARNLIDQVEIEYANKVENAKERENLLNGAYERFDKFANHLNYLFEQFSVNIVISRCGIIPKQDDRITKDIYEPTLEILSDPKWNSVNSILDEMFTYYQNQQYSEVITNAHNAVHRFLQVALGKNGNLGKGEFGKLFKQAKSDNLISNNSEIEDSVKSINGFLSSERAKKSTAKPTSHTANSADALLVMNISIVLIQHCLQNINKVK